MEDISWITPFAKEFGLPGILLLILALTLRSIILSSNKRADTRETAILGIMKETTEATKEHTLAMRQLNEKLTLEKDQIITQVKRSEQAIKRHIDSKHESH